MKIKVITNLAYETVECDKFEVDGDGNLWCYTKAKATALFSRGGWHFAIEEKPTTEAPVRRGVTMKELFGNDYKPKKGIK